MKHPPPNPVSRQDLKPVLSSPLPTQRVCDLPKKLRLTARIKAPRRHAAQYARTAKTSGLRHRDTSTGQALTAQKVPQKPDDDHAEDTGGGKIAAGPVQQQPTPMIIAAPVEGTSTSAQPQPTTTRSADRGRTIEGGQNSERLRPSELTSPLSQRIVTWNENLITVHNHTCTSKANCCAGIRSLQIICKEEKSHKLSNCAQYQCLQAVEAELLLHSLYYGFPVLPEGTVPRDYPEAKTANYPCPERARVALSTAVDEEIRLGILKVVSKEPRHLTALTFKDEAQGKVRPIRDYSAPHDGTSVNAHWPSRHFRMMGLQDAYTLMTPHCYMAKVDIKSAFRTVSVRPDQQDVLSIDWSSSDPHRSRYLRDTRLPFGWAGSPEAFCRLTAAVRSMLAAAGHKSIIVYVDDFLIIGASREECQTTLDRLLQLLHALGFTVADNKTAGPTQDITFLGLRLQSNEDGAGRMTVEVPKDKLTEVVETVQLLLARNRKSTDTAQRGEARRRDPQRKAGNPQQLGSVTRGELQSLLGKLNHIGQAVYSSRAYTRGLIDALKAINAQRRKGTSSKRKGGSDGGIADEPRDPADVARSAPGASSIPLRKNLMRDLFWWVNFASHFNGETQLLEDPAMMPGYLATDAADWGMGGALNPSLEWVVADGVTRLTWFSQPWAAGYGHAVARLPKHMQHYMCQDMFPDPSVPNRWWIAYREQYALFYAILLWADSFRGRHICPFVDNTVAVATFNKLSATNWVMQRLVQAQAGLMADFNIRGTAIWIESAENVLGDPLSRGDLPAFHKALESWHPPQAPVWGKAVFSDPPLMEQAARQHKGLPAKRVAPTQKSGVVQLPSMQQKADAAYLQEEYAALESYNEGEDSIILTEWLHTRGR